MARTTAQISVGADTRQLERDIQNALSRDFKLKGFNEKAFTQPLGRITGASNEFQKSLDASNARVIAFGASAGSIYAIERAFADLIKSTINVQKSLTDINVILNTTSKELQRFGGDLFTVAKDTGQSFDVVAQAATELARQGLGVEETLKRTRDALILTRLSGLDTLNSVEALTATLNSFSKTALDSTQIINKLANVDAAFAVSSADLANAIQRVGSSAQDAGVGFDELLAIVTSVQQTTARGGAVIGNSLKTIFTRISRPEVLDQLENLGLQVRDIDGSTRPAISILQQLASTFDTLSDAQKSQIAESVGGVFQINILKAALGDLGKEYSVYNNALRTSSTATDEAIKRNAALNETLSALINRTFTNFTQLGAKIGAGAFQPAIESTLKNVNSILEGIANQDTESVGTKIGQGILNGLSTFISGPGLLLITAVIGKLFLDLTKFAATSVKTLIGIGKQAEQRAQIEGKISSILAQEPQLLAAINAKQISVLDVENRILTILKEQNALRAQAASLSTTITGGLLGKGVTVKGGQIGTKSLGFIPNFVMDEIYGALSGGYKPGKIKEMNIPGMGKTIYNSAERVKRFPNFSQPAILPPQNSLAGENYKNTFSSIHGFNPYSSQGFIPNFVSVASLVNRGFKKISNDQAEVLSRDPKFSQYIKGSATSGFFLDSSVEDQALKAYKVKTETKLLGRGKGILEEPDIEKTGAVLVYPAFGGGGLSSTSARANKYVSRSSGESPSFLFSTFGFPGKTAGLGEELYNDLQQKLKDSVYNFIEKATLTPKDLFDDARFENYVNTNVNRSTIESALGGVFEAGLKSAIFSAVDDPNAPLDLSASELTKLSRTFKGAKDLGKFTIGEVKNALNESNAESMANKIASSKGYKLKSGTKTKTSFGFIPNFSALSSAIGRELEAGIPAESIRIGKNRLLMSSKNPMGLGVYNTKDEPRGLAQGISRFRSSQDARQAGASSGFIPNYALSTIAKEEGGTIWTVPASKEAEKAVRQLINSVYKGRTSLDNASKELAELTRQYNLADSSQLKVTNQLRRAAELNQRLNTETEALVNQSSSLFRGRRSLVELERRASQSGAGAEMARGGLEEARARRDRLSSRLQGVGIGASIGVPILTNIAQEFAPNNKGVKFGATVLGDTAAFAGTGALFGPYGAAIGGLIGVTVGLTKAFNQLKDVSDELAKNSRESGNRVARFSENVQTFLTSREKAAGLESGSIQGTPADLAKISSQRDAAFAKIYAAVGPKTQKALAEAYARSNEAALQSALQQAQEEISSSNFVDQWIENANKQLQDGGKNLDFEDLLTQFTGIRTKSGKYIGDLLLDQKDLLGSFDILATASEKFYGINNQLADSIAATADASQKTVTMMDKLKDLMGFGRVERNTRTINQQPIGFGEVLETEFQSTNTNLGGTAKIVNKTAKAYSNELGKAFEDSASKLRKFIIELGKTDELDSRQVDNLISQIDKLLNNKVIPLEEKAKSLKKVFDDVGKASDKVAEAVKKLRDAQLNYYNLQQQSRQLFSKDKAQRDAAAAFIQIGDFGNVLKDFLETEAAQSFKPSNVLLGTQTSAFQGILGGTADENRRLELERKFGEVYKKASQEIAATGILSDRTLSELQVAVQNVSIESAMTTRNLTDLGLSIGDTALKTEVLNKYTQKESELKKQLGDNIIKLNYAASAAAESLKAVAAFKEGTIFADEYKQMQASAREKAIRSGTNKPTDMLEAFTDEMVYGTQDAFRDLNNLSADTARTMKSEFNNAFQSVIDGTSTVGDAFRGMALNISRRIQQLALEMSSNMAFNTLFSSVGGLPSIFKNPLGGKSKGGYIQKFSSGGKVLGGSGTRDDIPAMLSQGEYVIKKSSVNKYGTKFLDNLNRGGIVGLAKGGISENLIDEYLKNSIKTPASETDPGRVVDRATRDLFAQSLNDMIQNKDVTVTEAYSNLLASKSDFGGEFRGNLGAFYSYLGQDPRYPTAGSYVIDPLLSQFALSNENDPQNRIASENREQLFNYLQEGMDIYDRNRESIIDTINRNREEQARVNQINSEMDKNFRNQQRNNLFGGLLSAGMAVGSAALQQDNPFKAGNIWGSKKVRRATPNLRSSISVVRSSSASGDFYPYKYANYVKSGGLIRKYASGGYSNQDDVPAMLMGGEYVIRKDIVNNYGKRFFDDLNGGKIRKFADGGIVNGQEGVSKNDLKNDYSSENNINITVNVHNSGGEVKSVTTENNSNINNPSRAIEFADKLKSEIVKVIVEQQRPGGLLGSQKYSMK